MKYTYDEYQIMVQSAWSAFENTLKVWGVTDKQMDKFRDIVDDKDAYNAVSNALGEVIEWEDDEYL